MGRAELPYAESAEEAQKARKEFILISSASSAPPLRCLRTGVLRPQYRTWQFSHQKLRRCVRPRCPLWNGMSQRGQVRLVCASQCFFSTNAFFHSRKSKLYCARLAHQFAQLGRRQRADRGQRMHADAEQHLVLDDVAHAGEDVLVEQGVAGQHVRMRAQALARQLRVPVRRTSRRRASRTPGPAALRSSRTEQV